MKLVAREVEQKAAEALRTALKDVPFLQIVEEEAGRVNTDGGADLMTKVATPGGGQLILAKVKASGQPRIAREAVNQLVRYKERFPEAYMVFIAPYISPQAAEICAQDGVGYVDLAGNCRIAFDRVYIRKEGNPNPFAQKRDLRSLYSPKAERILRVLLTHPTRPWKTQPLAAEVQVSLGQVANVKKLLEDREWLQHDANGFRLVKPGELLAEWAEHYDFKRNEVHQFYSLEAPAEVETQLAQVCRRQAFSWGLTAFSGAERIAPYVRYQRVTAYVQLEEIEKVAGLTQLKPVPGGANVSLIAPYDAGVFYSSQEKRGVRIVSPVQIYLDLRSLGGRGEDAAEFLMREVIQPQW